MAKRSGPSYEPGELDRVRGRLGPLGDEEAKKMADRLGGEVGNEAADSGVEAGYRDLRRSTPAARPDRAAASRPARPRQAQQVGSAPPQRPAVARAQSSPTAATRLGYRDRVRVDFSAATNGYRLKSFGGAVATLFSFAGAKDYVNPRLVQSTSTAMFAKVENLAGTAAALVAATKNQAQHVDGVSVLSRQIIAVLADWDARSIHALLSTLQRTPRNVEFRQLDELLRKIYRPLILLGEVDEVATARALREHFELAKRELGEKQADIERLTRRFMEARSVLPEVMRSLGKGMYPALLKQVGKTFRSYDELMVLERESLLDFVGATSEEVLDYDPDLDRPATADGPVPSEAARAHPAAEPAQHAPLTAGTLKGLELLEQLFPQAGWERLQEWPDLYAYFQPILRFPRGFEHIARTDPLHQLLIFVSVLGELLPPLRKVEFTQLVGETDLRANLAGIADRWHAFTHEIFGNLLVPRLADLCQNLEREPKYLDSTMAQRMRDEINWVRRGYFLPHMAFTQTFPVDAVVRKELPKFHQTVASLRQSLAAVARSLDDSVRTGRAAGTPIQEITCPGVGNPWVEINFEVDSPVARRLRMALRQRVVGANGEARLVNKFNNANLVFHTLSLCITFDHLVNSRGSHLYSAASGIHFRSVLDDNRTPASAVAFVGTEAMLGERVNPERARATLAALRHQISSDPDTGLGTRAALHERAQQAIADSRGNSSPLSVVALSLAEATAQGDRASGPPATSTVTGVALALVDDAAEAETVLEVYRDGPASFTILAPGQDYPAVVKLTHRILAQIDGAFSQVVVTAGVAQFSGRGREGELLAQAVAARRLATREGARVALADPRSGELRLAPLGEDP